MPSAILSLRVTRNGIVGGGGLVVIMSPARAAWHTQQVAILEVRGKYSLSRRPSGAGNILPALLLRQSGSVGRGDEADGFVFLQLLHDAGELSLRDSSHRNADFVQTTGCRSTRDRQLVGL